MEFVVPKPPPPTCRQIMSRLHGDLRASQDHLNDAEEIMIYQLKQIDQLQRKLQQAKIKTTTSSDNAAGGKEEKKEKKDELLDVEDEVMLSEYWRVRLYTTMYLEKKYDVDAPLLAKVILSQDILSKRSPAPSSSAAAAASAPAAPPPPKYGDLGPPRGTKVLKARKLEVELEAVAPLQPAEKRPRVSCVDKKLNIM